MDYNKKAKTLEIAIKIFSDDLGEVLSEEEGTVVEIGTDREHQDATSMIKDYLEEHFVVEVNGKKKPFRYITRKTTQEDFYAIWVLLEVPKVNNIKTLKLKNDILIAHKNGQRNYVKFREDRDQGYTRHVASEGQEELILK